MAGVREDLEAFAAELFDGFFRADQRRWGQAYVRGLLLDRRRKSVEPMAARLGETATGRRCAGALLHCIGQDSRVPATASVSVHTRDQETAIGDLWESL